MTVISRRNFLKASGSATIGLWIGISMLDGCVTKKSVAGAKNFTPYILVDSDNNITIYNIKPELGQGTFQSIPSLIAEEFEVTLDAIKILNSNGEKVLGPHQSAGGSSSVRGSYNDLRKVGASAKEMFIAAAATKWGVNVSDCYAENGKVFNKSSHKSFTYGDLVEEASGLDVPKDPKLKDPKDFKILGKPVPRPDIPMKVGGTAQFGIDAAVPGMVYASVQRCPVIGGTLKSFDAADAMKVPGVLKVVEAERKVGKYSYVGVAVVADNYWAALKGRKALRIEWDTKGYEKFNSADYENKLRSLAEEDGLVDKQIGSVTSVHASSANTCEALYETPVAAHSTMEPINCTVHVQGDKVDLWTSTQVPSSVTGERDNNLPALIGHRPEDVTLHAAFVGGGFGRRLYLDFMVEAVNIAKQIDKPVKVIWTREDTTQFGPFRPMTFSKLKGSVSGEGKLISFEHKVISPSLHDSSSSAYDKTKIDGSMVEGIGAQDYEMPNLKTSFVLADYHVPVCAWRSVTSSTLAFAHECFIDELANKAKKDPFDFRMEMLTKSSDTKRVLQKLREASDWDTKLPAGKGRGVAQWLFFAGLCGQVVEVSYVQNKIKVDKVTAVIDLGTVVNPDTVKAQVEGAIIMALTAASKPGITLADGKVQQANFDTAPVLRINEAPPEINVIVLAEGEEKIKGVGEPGLPPFAPALGNAIFAATGKRIRKLPVDLTNI
ncbi:MAG TPA: molybdopterin cofactor-binding domain-containing protein [Chitinophagaceae bacterium]|nr:molybdopterin cofactor-binding domain-containing protein [Chitinophagaceae bacterium]